MEGGPLKHGIPFTPRHALGNCKILASRFSTATGISQSVGELRLGV
jgi:hypothetical protein